MLNKYVCFVLPIKHLGFVYSIERFSVLIGWERNNACFHSLLSPVLTSLFSSDLGVRRLGITCSEENNVILINVFDITVCFQNQDLLGQHTVNINSDQQDYLSYCNININLEALS